MSVLIATKVNIHFHEIIVAFMVFANDIWHMNFIVVKIIDLVEKHGTSETDFTVFEDRFLYRCNVSYVSGA